MKLSIKMKQLLGIGGLFISLIIVSFFIFNNLNNTVNYTTIDIKEFKNMLSNKDFVLINVHTPYVGDITKTDMSLPYNKIENTIQLSKNRKIVLYCQSGFMSKIAAEKLAKKGFVNIYTVEGGMNAWKASGNSILYK